LLILAAVLAITAASRTASQRSQASVPVMTLLPRALPTETASPSPTAPTPSPSDTPQPASTQDATAARIEVGRMVEVYGTEGDGLRLRADPSTEAVVLLLAGESEVFSVEDGPVEADGRTWFFVVSPSDASRAGWAVSDYLRLAQ
jgi:hypothetical protein